MSSMVMMVRGIPFMMSTCKLEIDHLIKVYSIKT